MKLTKNEFKAMIKDCIKELLKEGAFDNALLEAASQNRRVPSAFAGGNKTTAQPSQRSLIDSQKAKAIARKLAGADDFRYGPGLAGVGGDFSDDLPEDLASVRLTQQAPGLQKLVESAAQNVARGDQGLASQYASIFADTALNTIPRQMAEDPQRGSYAGLAGLGAHQQVEKVTTEDMQRFAPMGDMSHWAQLAFGTAGKK